VSEAVERRHQVTAVVREPGRHPDLHRGGVDVVAGDATLADSVAAVSAGHDAAISAVARMDVPAQDFYVAAAHALLDGLARAGVPRAVLVGIGTTLETAPGIVVHDDPNFPAEARAFSMGHLAELETLRAADSLDWLVVAPPPVVLDDAAAAPDRRYRIGGGTLFTGDASPSFSYGDLAVVLVDEVERPEHHRTLAAVARELT
jgi:hypothetical protein